MSPAERIHISVQDIWYSRNVHGCRKRYVLSVDGGIIAINPEGMSHLQCCEAPCSG